jgi:hypothetical protein
VLDVVDHLFAQLNSTLKGLADYTARMYATLPLLGINLVHGTEVVVETIHQEIERAGHKISLIITIFIDRTKEASVKLMEAASTGLAATGHRHPRREPRPFNIGEAPFIVVRGIDSDTHAQVAPEAIGPFDEDWVRPCLQGLDLESGLRNRNVMLPTFRAWDDE